IVDADDHPYFPPLVSRDPISDQKYAEQLQLHEALVFSSASRASTSSSPKTPIVILDSQASRASTSFSIMTPKVILDSQASRASTYSPKTPIVILESKASCVSTSSSPKTPNVILDSQDSHAYESNQVADRICDICMDTKTESEMFRNTKVCGHMYCLGCIRGHVAAKIQENITKVRCPDPNCKGVIGPEACRLIVPREVLERWEYALCESLILGSEKFYCPFKDCSALLVNDGGGAVTSSECPHCNRLFCAQCKVTWHSGICCSEYQSLRKDERDPSDLMLMDLAKNNKWKRCPNCNFYVERTTGCEHIACRVLCGNDFDECITTVYTEHVREEEKRKLKRKEELDLVFKHLPVVVVFGIWGDRCGHDFDYNTGSYLSMSEEEEEEEEEDEEEENWIAEKGIGLRSFTVRLKIVLLVDDDGGIVTSEYQTLKKDERDPSNLMLRDLAKSKAWKRCGHTFCYGCGKYHRDHRWHKLVTEDAETVGVDSLSVLYMMMDQYFPTRMYRDYDDLHVPPLMERNDADDPYIQPLIHYGDQIFHKYDDDNDDDDDDDQYFTPRKELIRWEIALCESMILGSQKFYCPFKDCSALLVDDGRQTVTSSECPNCNRLLIATDCLCESMMARGDGLQAVSDGHKGIMEEKKERPNEPEMSDNKNTKHLDVYNVAYSPRQLVKKDIAESLYQVLSFYESGIIQEIGTDKKRCHNRLNKGRIDMEYSKQVQVEFLISKKSDNMPIDGAQEFNYVMESLVHRIQHGNNKRADKAKLYNEIRNVNDTIDACREPAEPDDDPDPSGRYGWNWRPNHDKRNKQRQLKLFEGCSEF
ncbi:zinc finger, C6HC-type containing protein, partial [Tanacetum coccineum]